MTNNMSLVSTEIPNIDEISEINISYCLLMVGEATILTNRHDFEVGDKLDIDLSQVKVDASNTIPLDFKLGFKWYRDGEEIIGANTETYTITNDDLNTKICAEVIALEDNFEGNIRTPEIEIHLHNKGEE